MKFRDALSIFSVPQLQSQLNFAWHEIEDLKKQLEKAENNRGPCFREVARAELPFLAAQLHKGVLEQVQKELTPMLSREAVYHLQNIMREAPTDRDPMMLVAASMQCRELMHVEVVLPELRRRLDILI